MKRLLALGITAAVLATLAACDSEGPAPIPSPAATASPTAIPTATPAASPAATPSPAPSPEASPQSACAAVPPLTATVSDQAGLYSISIPADWATTVDEGALGVRVSRIIVESPDFSVTVDEMVEGPHDLIYYETGATFTVHVTTPVQPPPYHFGGVTSESAVTVDGAAGTYHVFKEPSTAAGQLLDAHVSAGGNEYVIRMGYNPATCPAAEDLFAAILDSFRFE